MSLAPAASTEIHDSLDEEIDPGGRAGDIGLNGPSVGLAIPYFAFMVQ
jgi:hypothetical protein